MQPIENIVGDDSEDTILLRKMADDARDYITSFSWCPPINSMYLGFGIGGVVAIFLVEFAHKIARTENRLWVVEGDLPSAYLVVGTADTPRMALEQYCELMDGWVEAVRNSGDFSEVFPVAAPKTSENADLLSSRVGLLRSEIVPRMP
ncbi:MAG TPA: hypothetical protein VGH23_11855 [Rhizomicrobium sp.]